METGFQGKQQMPIIGGNKNTNMSAIGLSKTTPAGALGPCLNRKATKPSQDDDLPPPVIS